MRIAEYSKFLSNNTVFACSGCSPPPPGEPTSRSCDWNFPLFPKWILLKWKLCLLSIKRQQEGSSWNHECRAEAHWAKVWLTLWFSSSAVGTCCQPMFPDSCHVVCDEHAHESTAIGEYQWFSTVHVTPQWTDMVWQELGEPPKNSDLPNPRVRHVLRLQSAQLRFWGIGSKQDQN